jgi:predicted GNAT family acetyltransferase
MYLSHVRQQWERGKRPLVVIPIPPGLVLVVLRDNKDHSKHALHRYFEINGPNTWDASIDVRGNLDTVLAALSKDSNLNDLYSQISVD